MTPDLSISSEQLPIYDGYIGHYSGDAPEPVQLLPAFISDELNGLLDSIGLSPARPARAAVSPADARAAREIMEAESIQIPHQKSDLISHQKTDCRIVLDELDQVVASLFGWRRHEVPGGFVLDVPPRLVPDGWREYSGVIQKNLAPLIDFPAWDPLGLGRNYYRSWPRREWPEHFAIYENIGIPKWLIEERERSHERSSFADEYLCEPISCPDGHRATGKPSLAKEPPQ